MVAAAASRCIHSNTTATLYPVVINPKAYVPEIQYSSYLAEGISSWNYSLRRTQHTPNSSFLLLNALLCQDTPNRHHAAELEAGNTHVLHSSSLRPHAGLAFLHKRFLVVCKGLPIVPLQSSSLTGDSCKLPSETITSANIGETLLPRDADYFSY